MKPATRPASHRAAVRLLALDAHVGEVRVHELPDLPQLLASGDLVVVNDAATFPASVAVETETGEAIEIRITALRGNRATAIAFGEGDWRVDTSDRPPPPRLEPGARLLAGGQLFASVGARSRDTESNRLLELELHGDDPLETLYTRGRAVQYSYLENDLALWSVQTSFASRPVAAEMPSAGRPLSWSVLLELRRRGINIARLTHAAGLSSSGEARLDARFPLPEWYDIPAETVAAITQTRRRGGRIVAVGTTVVRALESAARRPGGLAAGQGTARLRIDPSTDLLVVDSILTGLHDSMSSHYELLGAFAERAHIDAGWNRARDAGFRAHELGDVALIAPALARRVRAPDRDSCAQRRGAAPRRPKSSSMAVAAAMAT